MHLKTRKDITGKNKSFFLITALVTNVIYKLMFHKYSEFQSISTRGSESMGKIKSKPEKVKIVIVYTVLGKKLV